MSKPYATIDARGLGIPTPSQIKDDIEKNGGPDVAFVHIEMSCWRKRSIR